MTSPENRHSLNNGYNCDGHIFTSFVFLQFTSFHSVFRDYRKNGKNLGDAIRDVCVIFEPCLSHASGIANFRWSFVLFTYSEKWSKRLSLSPDGILQNFNKRPERLSFPVHMANTNHSKHLYVATSSSHIAARRTVATLTKFLIGLWQRFDIFLTTFCWLPLKLTNQNTRIVGGDLSSAMLFFRWANGNSTSHSPCALIDQMQRKPTASCQKDVKKLSQTNQELCLVATVRCPALY